MTDTYRDRVRERFPNKGREVPHGYVGPVEDRITGETKTITEWYDKDYFVSQETHHRRSVEHSIWYVIPAE